MTEDRIQAEGVTAMLHEAARCRVEVYDELPSTNLEMRQRLAEDEGLVLVAEQQSAGIGRLGRRFHSPVGTGLYFSVLLKPDGRTDPIQITAMAAVAVCRAIERVLSLSVRIKWVNDIFFEDRKVCGILAQGVTDPERGCLSHVILGIGVNVYAPEGGFPEELQGIAGALTDQPKEQLRSRLLAAILNELFVCYDGKTDPKDTLEAYRSHSLLYGKRVTVHTPTASREATVLSIDDDYHLVVCYEADRSVAHLQAGEVSVRM